MEGPFLGPSIPGMEGPAVPAATDFDGGSLAAPG